MRPKHKLITWAWDDNDPIKKIVSGIRKNPTWNFYKFPSGMTIKNHGVIAATKKDAIQFFGARLNMSLRDASMHTVRIT